MSEAIAHYTRQGHQVLIPLGDRQKYDLVIDNGSRLQKVQCKYTSSKEQSGAFTAQLRVMGGNQSYQKVHRYELGDFDLLFVMTSDGSLYEVPAEVALKNRSTITLGEKYEDYRVVGRMVLHLAVNEAS